MRCGDGRRIMKRRGAWVWLGAAALAVVLAGCGGSDADEQQVPAMLRHQFQTQMKTILHDLQVAQEQAATLEGSYLELAELRRKYFNRPVPENYELSLGEVTANSYSAEVVHKASGLSCRLEVGGGATGVSRCR